MKKINFISAVVIVIFMAVVSCSKEDPIPVPTITEISQSYAKRGESITISGSNFSNTTKVTINGVEATVTQVSGNSITVTVPDTATPGNIIVNNGGGQTATQYLHVYIPATGLFFSSWVSAYSYTDLRKVDLDDYSSGLVYSGSIEKFNFVALTAIDDENIYFADERNNKILSGKKDASTGLTELFSETDGVAVPSAIAVDPRSGMLYWNNSGTNTVMRGNINGDANSVETLFGGTEVLTYSYGLQLDTLNEKIYFSDFGNEDIRVGNLDGTGTPEVLYEVNTTPVCATPSNIFVDGYRGKIYWTSEVGDWIVEANLDGTGNVVTLFNSENGVDRPDGIAVDYASGKIYWTETGAFKTIYQGNLDGTGSRSSFMGKGETESYGIVLDY